MAATAANIELKARVVAVTATVELVVNGHVIDTVDVEVQSATEKRAFNGTVVNVTNQGLRDLDLDDLRKRAEMQALSRYTGH